MWEKVLRILWAPWRIDYIEKAKSGEKEPCFLCESWNGIDKDKLVVYRGKDSMIIMNKYPYNSGHIMICPKTHTAEISEISLEERIEIFELLELSIEALREAIKPHGFNIGINLGKIAGAGLEDHIHIHVVPRWAGDTNFMFVTGNSKVIVEDILTTTRKIREKLSAIIEEKIKNKEYSRKK